jgi:hypothetical protein
MKTDNKEMHPPPKRKKGHGRNHGACFLRTEAIMRSVCFPLIVLNQPAWR